MAINFPTSLDNFTNPASGNTLDSPSHSLQHSDINDAVEALEAKVGIGASPAGSATAGQVLTISAAGTSTWSTPTGAGLVLISSSSFSGATTHSFGSDASPIFTSTYTNYKIILDNLLCASTTTNITFRVRANTTDLTAGDYNSENLLASGASVSAALTANGTSWIIGQIGSDRRSSIVMEIHNPQTATDTTFESLNYVTISGTGSALRVSSGLILNTNSYNGLTIIGSSNIQGTISIYGYRK